MIYKLLKKKIGTKQFTNLIELETSNTINDICYVEDFGFVYSSGRCLGKISTDMKNLFPWKGNREEIEKKEGDNPVFGNVFSVFYNDKSKKLYISEDSGRNVVMLSFPDGYASRLMKGQNKEKMNTVLKNKKETLPSYVCSAGEKTYIAMPSIRKIFCHYDSKIDHVLGDGKSRFSVCSNPTLSSIGIPSGVAIYGDNLLISDSTNNIIRSFKNGKLSVLFGELNSSFIDKPSKIIIDKNNLYIMCKGYISTFLLGRQANKNIPLYESEKISNMTIHDGCIYILEESNAKS